MKLSSLKRFFEGDISAGGFRNEIKEEIEGYKKLLKKKGSSIPIIVTEYVGFTVNKAYINVLCKAFLNNFLDEFEVNYIVDVLQLSEVEFESEELFDLVSTLTDSEINGELKKNIDEVMQYCNSYK